MFKQQKIKLGEKELTLQSVGTREKLEFRQMGINNLTGKADLVALAEFTLKKVVVVPQGLKLEDFEQDELEALVRFVADFLGVNSEKKIDIEVLD